MPPGDDAGAAEETVAGSLRRRWMLAMGMAAVVFTGADFGAAQFVQ
jgi:hypothetical protein